MGGTDFAAILCPLVRALGTSGGQRISSKCDQLVRWTRKSLPFPRACCFNGLIRCRPSWGDGGVTALCLRVCLRMQMSSEFGHLLGERHTILSSGVLELS